MSRGAFLLAGACDIINLGQRGWDCCVDDTKNRGTTLPIHEAASIRKVITENRHRFLVAVEKQRATPKEIKGE